MLFFSGEKSSFLFFDVLEPNQGLENSLTSNSLQAVAKNVMDFFIGKVIGVLHLHFCVRGGSCSGSRCGFRST